MSKEFGKIDFLEALPRLVANYNKGKLVPFTGAGISMDSIPDWKGMIMKICLAHDIQFPKTEKPSTQLLIQLSDQIVTKLTRQSRAIFIEAIEKSLNYDGPTDPPTTQQCEALVKLWWPLILSTNYDKMLVSAYNQYHKANNRSELKVFGRHPTDCHSLLSLVNAGTGPSYWALQGYLGKSTNQINLKDEIVMGHRQYRNATYGNPTFRAVFGEIYRNHSLLFLGSGLSEDYFTGLFGEVLEKYGRNPFTHYALFSGQDRETIDHKFLLTRLNIMAVFYPDNGPKKYAGLCTALNELKNHVEGSGTRLWKIGYGERYLSKLTNKRSALELEIIAGTMPDLQEGECIVYSAGSQPNGIKLSDHGVKRTTELFKDDKPDSKFHQLGQFKCWQYKNSDIFAAVARNDKDGTSRDRRDLRMVQVALLDTILALHKKYSVINIMLLAAGEGKTFPPVHSLIAMIRGYKEAARDKMLKDNETFQCTVRIHVVDPSVLAYIRRNPLEIEEIISCDDIRLNIEIRDGQDIERFQVYLKDNLTLAGVSDFFSIRDAFWEVRIEPLPYQGQQLLPGSEEKISLIGLIPGSTILYSRKEDGKNHSKQ